MTVTVHKSKELTILPDYDGSCVVMVKGDGNLDLKAFDKLLLGSPLYILWTLCEDLKLWPDDDKEFTSMVSYIEDQSAPFRDPLAGGIRRDLTSK